MSGLAVAAVVVGCLLIISGLLALAVPGTCRRWAARFPRSKPMGWVLTMVDIVWVGCIVHHAPLGRFEPLKPLVFIGVPLACALIALFMDELLAPRALGGLLLLGARPILAAAFLHHSNARLVMTVAAYAWVVAGMSLVLSPYRFRQAAAVMIRSDARARCFGALRFVVGVTILLLGLTTY